MSAGFLQILCLLEQVLPSPMDAVSGLPTELVSTIFRYLDPKSLTSASKVNRRWNSVCKNDKILRGRIRKHLREERETRQRNYLEPSRSIEVTRRDPGTAFGRRNGNVMVKAVPVQYDIDLNNNTVKIPKARLFKISAIQPEMKGTVKTVGKKKAGSKANKNITYTRLRL